MKADSLLGVWAGTAHNTNGWDMKITLSILQPIQADTMLGVFDIPMIPCSGTFRVVSIHGDTLELRAEKLQGDCLQADSEILEMLPEGTLLYAARGKNWEAQGTLRRVIEE